MYQFFKIQIAFCFNWSLLPPSLSPVHSGLSSLSSRFVPRPFTPASFSLCFSSSLFALCFSPLSLSSLLFRYPSSLRWPACSSHFFLFHPLFFSMLREIIPRRTKRQPDRRSLAFRLRCVPFASDRLTPRRQLFRSPPGESSLTPSRAINSSVSSTSSILPLFRQFFNLLWT